MCAVSTGVVLELPWNVGPATGAGDSTVAGLDVITTIWAAGVVMVTVWVRAGLVEVDVGVGVGAGVSWKLTETVVADVSGVVGVVVDVGAGDEVVLEVVSLGAVDVACVAAGMRTALTS